MNEKTKGMSQTRQVFTELRAAIVGGRMLPGSKLNIAALADELDVSAGAVREGLAMLEAEALVVSEPARGYRVSPISETDLEELVKARIEIEKPGKAAWSRRTTGCRALPSGTRPCPRC